MQNGTGFIIHTTAVFLILFFLDSAWAFGPHGNGAIGSAIERAELPRGFPVYQNYDAPYSYPSMTRRDLVPLIQEGEAIEVEGTSETMGFFIPLGLFIGLGPTSGLSVDLNDRSIRAAVEDAKTRYGVRNLYDIRIDVRYFSILGIYNKTTTIVHAKAVKDKTQPPNDNPPP